MFLTSAAFGSPRFNEAIDGKDLPLILERHKRIYFIAGEENTKVQISAKIPVYLGAKLFLAYTETGFWKLFQQSSNPFEDINHNPELFYRWDLHEDHALDSGLEHLSNGQDGVNSRSWNSAYAQLMSKFDMAYFTSKAYYLWDVEATNGDIKKYLGFIDFEFGLKELIRSKFQSNEVYIRWRPGAKLSFDSTSYNTVELGLKIKFSNWKVFQHFFINYYNGYAENQLNYDSYTNALRAGVTF